MRKLFAAVVTMTAMSISMLAADVAGKWVAEMTSPDGQKRQSTFDFKVDGDKLSGTVANARGETKIEDGTVKGDDISFSVTRNFGGNEVKMKYKGKVTGNEMKLNVDAGERSFEMTAKRPAS